jgi:hypothetical protein
MSEVWAVSDIDFKHIVAVQNKIKSELVNRLSDRQKKRVSTAERALRSMLKSTQFDDLVGELATAAVVYEAGAKPATFDPCSVPHITPVESKRGRPPRPEVQALLVDVRNSINDAIKMSVGLYQNDGGSEGIVLEVARIVARSVRKPLSNDIRKQIAKARKVTPTFVH